MANNKITQAMHVRLDEVGKYQIVEVMRYVVDVCQLLRYCKDREERKREGERERERGSEGGRESIEVNIW